MKFHIISKRDLSRLIKQGDVVLNGSENYVFHGDAQNYITLYIGGIWEGLGARGEGDDRG